MVTSIINVDNESTGTELRRELGRRPSTMTGVWTGFVPGSSGTIRSSLRDHFRVRAREWQEATGHWSAPSRIYSHPTYLRLLVLGSGIVPLILEDIRDGATCDWYNALRFFAGTLVADGFDPVTDAERGDVDLMDAAWLRWGRNNGYID